MSKRKNSVDLLRGGVRQVEELLQLVHEARDDLLNQGTFTHFSRDWVTRQISNKIEEVFQTWTN